MQFCDPVILITGGVSGVGRACAQGVLAEGAQVLIVDRDPGGTEVASELQQQGSCVEFVQSDTTVETDICRAVQQTKDRFGQLDAVTTCAGISGRVGSTAPAISIGGWGRVMAVNVRR